MSDALKPCPFCGGVPKVYLTDEQWGKLLDYDELRIIEATVIDAVHLELVRRGIEANERLAAPPSDKEMLRQFATAAMQGVMADPNWAGTALSATVFAFDVAEAMLAELNQRTEGGK